MTNSDVDQENINIGKKKNGHKHDCGCHICENMKNKAKRGGYSEEIEKKREYINGEVNKKNGHRKNCKCPICKNMKNYKKSKRGGDNNYSDSNNMSQDLKKENTFNPGNRVLPQKNEYFNDNDNDNDDDNVKKNVMGGTRKYKKKIHRKRNKSKVNNTKKKNRSRKMR